MKIDHLYVNNFIVFFIPLVFFMHFDKIVFAQSGLDGQFEMVWPDTQRITIATF